MLIMFYIFLFIPFGLIFDIKQVYPGGIHSGEMC